MGQNGPKTQGSKEFCVIFLATQGNLVSANVQREFSATICVDSWPFVHVNKDKQGVFQRGDVILVLFVPEVSVVPFM